MQDIPSHYEAALSSSYFLEAFASVIKIPAQTGPVSYADLVCTPQDQDNIYEIITTLAENGKISLLFKKNHLESLGSQIKHLHPLKFLSTIVCHPELRRCLYPIFDDYFKRNGFMDGIGPSLTRAVEKGNLGPYIDDFSAEVQMPRDKMEKYFRSKDWEALVRLFIP